MAVTTIQSNNKLIVFKKEITREYVRQNLFTPYVGDQLTAIIRIINDLKKGGEQINIPLIARLKDNAISTGTLVGNEETIDNFGDRMYRLGAKRRQDPKAEEQKSSIDLFGQRVRCSKTGARSSSATRSSTPSTRSRPIPAPAGLGSTNGQRVNGALFDAPRRHSATPG